jgi:hypothetical protein
MLTIGYINVHHLRRLSITNRYAEVNSKLGETRYLYRGGIAYNNTTDSFGRENSVSKHSILYTLYTATGRAYVQYLTCKNVPVCLYKCIIFII